MFTGTTLEMPKIINKSRIKYFLYFWIRKEKNYYLVLGIKAKDLEFKAKALRIGP